MNAPAAAPHAPSWYAATAGPGPLAPPLDGSTHADVCIIGGGYTGLSAALHLARSGASVRLTEANAIGWGASGRNGGQAHIGMRREQPWLERVVGQDAARALWRIGQDARDHLQWLMNDQGVACGYAPGLAHLDHKPGFVDESHRLAEHLREHYGYDLVAPLNRDQARTLVASDDYHGGMMDRGGGHLHALDLALGIGRAAERAGALLHAATRVTRIGRRQGGFDVQTDRGVISADRVILAANGYLQGLVPRVEARVMPINNYIAVTAPLGEAGARALIAENVAVSDSRFVVYYFRTTPDHRLLFGGGESYGYTMPHDIAGFVRRHIMRIFPQMRDVAIDHAWGGTLAITPRRMPYVREIEPGLFNLSGYSGMGVVLAPWFGKLAADAIAGRREDFDRLTALPVPRFPGGRWLRWPTLVAAMGFLALRDRL